MGFREHLVRTDNQIGYSLFGRIRLSGGTRVVLGRDHYLYEDIHLRPYNKMSSFSETSLRRTARRVKKLQDALARRQIAFLLVVAPSKVEIYPEHLPLGSALPGRESRQTVCDILGPLLVEAGVNHINGHDLFLEWKRADPTPLFSAGGAHWNYYGAARIVERTMRRLEELTGRDFIGLRCTGARMETWVKGTDNDLGELLNLWTRDFACGPHAHPVIERDAQPPARSANLLFVGDSFALTLVDLLDEERVCSHVDFLYYFKRKISYPGATSHPFEHSTAELRKELDGRDAIVIEINEIWLPEIGFGFVDQMLAALAQEPRGAEAGQSEAGSLSDYVYFPRRTRVVC